MTTSRNHSNKNNLIIGTICARGGSKGLPGKNLRYLADKPLIAHTIECAKNCPILQRVLVSTDEKEIAKVAERYGAEVPFMRPEYLATDCSSKWLVFRHLVKTFEQIEKARIEILVDLDTGVPLRRPGDIVACVNRLVNSRIDLVVTAYEAERNPYFNMVELNETGYAHISKTPHKPIINRQNAPRVYSLSPGVYAIRRKTLWEYEHWSKSRFQIHVIPRERAIDIDSDLDFRFAEYLLKRQEYKNVS